MLIISVSILYLERFEVNDGWSLLLAISFFSDHLVVTAPEAPGEDFN